MELEEFKTKLISESEKMGITIVEQNVKKFYEYMNLLIEWNEKINLTAITEPNDVIKKHFIDSLTIQEFVKEQKNVIDVGTGAGFPGIPLAINANNKVTLLDSLNKRINFLNEVKNELKLDDVICVHGRAEDAGKNSLYREQYDVAVSRAVAPMNVLVEYLLPFVKIGGICICMKGPSINEEMDSMGKALKTLGGEIREIKNIKMNNGEVERNIVIIKKILPTPKGFPRKAGTPSKEPLT